MSTAQMLLLLLCLLTAVGAQLPAAERDALIDLYNATGVRGRCVSCGGADMRRRGVSGPSPGTSQKSLAARGLESCAREVT